MTTERKSKKVTLEILQEAWNNLKLAKQEYNSAHEKLRNCSSVFSKLTLRTSATIVKQFAQTVNFSSED